MTVSLSLSIVSHLDENDWDRLYFKCTFSYENLEEKNPMAIEPIRMK